MLQFNLPFHALVTAITAPTESERTHIIVPPKGGIASGAYIGVVGSEPAPRSRVQTAAGAQVYEGVVAKTESALWSGTEVYGTKSGVPSAQSGLVEGFRAFVIHINDVARAAKVAQPEHVDGYITGPSVDELSDGVALDGPREVFVLALVAGLEQNSGSASYVPLSDDEVNLYLDGVYSDIAVEDWVIVEESDSRGAVKVTSATVLPRALAPGQNQPTRPVTVLAVSPPPFPGNPANASGVRIWFNAKKAGTLERIPTKTVKKGDFLNTPVPVTLPENTLLPAEDTHILIQDAEGKVVRAKGGGQQPGDTPQILITELLQEVADDEELVKPITFLWGLTKVTRGQTVHREIIGSGDATQRWQSFRLAKSPLTYVADPHAPGGRRPELEVYVNGLKWRRAQSFYKATPRDEIYVIRHDADHNTFIQFGDGELGKRLPTGKNNIVATYRYGVGGNVEANTITELHRPIPGVESVTNPLPATGGEDPPTEQEAREKAIQSTRVLGRLVSLPDFEVEAARYGGVIRARARWAWDAAGEDAVVKVWIICADEGDPSADLRRYLMGMAEPGVRVEVYLASKYAGDLRIDLELDLNYLPDEVWAAVDARLFDDFDGLLAPRNVPIGGAFHRSELYGAIHEIPGVISVSGVFVDDVAMDKVITLGEGEYLAIAYPEAT